MNSLTEYGDLTELCVRNSARAVVARHYGIGAYWRVTQLDYWDRSNWVSNIILAPLPGGNSLGMKRVGVAAIIAVQVYEGSSACPYQIEEFVCCDLLGEQEREWLGDYTIRDISNAARLVARKWSHIQFEVDSAASDYEVTP